MRIVRTAVLCLLAQATAAAAQDHVSIAANTQFMYGAIKQVALHTADKMPEENYTFRPTEAVRTFGQVVGHIADSETMFCALVLGEKNPAPQVEKTKTSKSEIVAALKDTFAYCDRAYASLNDANAGQTVKLFGRDTPLIGVLTANLLHTMEHYGNLVTYMRLKNVVPPTSEPGFNPMKPDKH